MSGALTGATMGNSGQQWATMGNTGATMGNNMQQWATMGNNGQQWRTMDMMMMLLIVLQVLSMMGIETSGEEADQLFATVDTNRSKFDDDDDFEHDDDIDIMMMI